MARIVRAKAVDTIQTERPVPRVNRFLWDAARAFGIDYGDARTRVRYLRAEGLFPYARKVDHVTPTEAANLVMAFAGARTQDDSANAVHRYSNLTDPKGQVFRNYLQDLIDPAKENEPGLSDIGFIQFYWEQDFVFVGGGKFSLMNIPEWINVFGKLEYQPFFLSAYVPANTLMDVLGALLV